MLAESVYIPLRRSDYLWLSGYCLILFGICCVAGRPLTAHEAVLPETAKEMFQDGDLVVPKKGGTPWMESPPLPQWITVALAVPFGACDSTAVVRLGSVAMGLITVLLTAWMAALWYGRQFGLLAGFVMATTFEFTRYAWLAEDEIFLCAVITAATAMFVKLEFSASAVPRRRDGWFHTLFGARSYAVVGFFVLMGMTNLVKGLMFGTVMASLPMFAFLVLSKDPARWRRYAWFWGYCIYFGISAAWPWLAYQRYPDVVEVWKFDLGGRLDGSYTAINEPIWYYPVNLLWMLLPWTFVIPVGAWLTGRRAWQFAGGPERFLWCWALAVPLVFSIPAGKHHHYLLHALAPWSILATHGLLAARRAQLSWPAWLRNPFLSLATTALPLVIVTALLKDKIPGPAELPMFLIAAIPILTLAIAAGLASTSHRKAATTLFGSLLGLYIAGHWLTGTYIDKYRHDAAFLHQVRNDFSKDAAPLLVDLDQELRGFMCLFYLDDKVQPIPNLTFLIDTRFDVPRALVLTRAEELPTLRAHGRTTVLLESARSAAPDGGDRLTLFELQFDDDIQRVSSKDVRVSPMQAMFREDGPFLRR